MRCKVDLARRLVAAALCLATASGGCGHSVLNPVLHDPDEPPSPGKRSPMLKVHLKSGELLVLDSWRLSDDRSRLEGTGTSFSVGREEGARGRQSVPIAAVALLETDSPEQVRPFGTSALAVMTTVVVGALAARSIESSSLVRLPAPASAELRPYARFPQGPPDGVDLRSLAAPAPLPE